ncbi:MAG: FG-GAP repeat domain-containing protein [Flavobacteriaceae bacterium]
MAASTSSLGAAVALAVALLATAAAAGERLPDGGVASAPGHGINRAWYEDPTGRYDHGILGDAIEATTLVAVAGGREYRVTLAMNEVIEDLTPRLADLDGDGGAEAAVIVSDLSRGSALAVYGVRGAALVRLAVTPFNGRVHRWLAPAGIADFDGDGRLEIAIVRTPHIGGTLEFYQLSGGRLVREGSARGFSNHSIGSRNLDEAAVTDVNGDSIPDLLLADAARTSIVAMTLAGGLRELGRVGLGAKLAGGIRARGGRVSVPTVAGVKSFSYRDFAK